MTDLMLVTQLAGEWESERRPLWINAAHVVTVCGAYAWRPEGIDRPRHSLIRLSTGETIKAVEQPEQIVRYLGGEYGTDPELPVVQAAELAEREAVA